MFRSFSFGKSSGEDHKKIFGLLEKWRLRQALSQLLAYCDEADEYLYRDLIVLSARFSATERAFDLKLISFEAWIQARCEVARAIIRVMQEISDPEI